MNESSTILERLQEEVLRHIRQSRTKPHLPVWGELFCTLRAIRRWAHENGRDAHVYDLHPSGSLRYSVEKGKFLAAIPELNLYLWLELTECVDAITEGRFAPAALQAKTDRNQQATLQPG